MYKSGKRRNLFGNHDNVDDRERSNDRFVKIYSHSIRLILIPHNV